MTIPTSRTTPEIAPKILVCEDESSLRELIRVTLGESYELIEAGDGDEALQLAQAQRPDAILLDVMLPGRSGLEVLQAVRSDSALAATPVIAVSAWSHMEDETIAAGANSFVAKPFDPDGLRAEVERLLTR